MCQMPDSSSLGGGAATFVNSSQESPVQTASPRPANDSLRALNLLV